MTERKSLYTAADVRSVREDLLRKQNNTDLITGLFLAPKDAVLDHCHKTQVVRGALHRQTNVFLGKVENAWLRYMQHWYPNNLSTFLKELSEYVDKDFGTSEYYHPGWMKRVKADFNKLTAKQQNKALELLGAQQGTNPSGRKELFSAVVLERTKGFEKIACALQQAKIQA